MTNKNREKIEDVIIKSLKKWMVEGFPKDARGWKQASGEIATIGLYLYDEYRDFKGVEKSIEKDVLAVSTDPAKHNKKWHKIIDLLIKKSESSTLERLYKMYGHWFADKNQQKIINDLSDNMLRLNESQNFDESGPKEDRNIDFMTNPTYQFKFDCGVIFENLVDPKEPNSPFSINYYVRTSKSLEDCFNNIDAKLAIGEGKMTQSDKDRLEVHINKYLK